MLFIHNFVILKKKVLLYTKIKLTLTMLNNLLAILIFGSTILLGIMLIANPLKVNKKANRWFGALSILWSTFWLEEMLIMVTGNSIVPDSLLLIKPLQYLSPLVFYISVEHFTNPKYHIYNKASLRLMIPYLTLIVLEYSLHNEFKLIKVIFLTLFCFTCILLSLLLIRKHKRDIQKFASNTWEIDLGWLEYIVWIIFILIIGVGIYNLTFFDAPLNVYMNTFIYGVILLTAYYSLKQKEVFPTDSLEREVALSSLGEQERDVIQIKIMNDERLTELKFQLNELIAKEELYLEPDMNLGKMAKRLNISSHQLSYVINNGYNLTFNNFVNKFRVEKAKQLLVNRDLNRYSIVGIAYESGFNSKTSFNTMFKKITGQTPSEYKKINTVL